MTWNKDSLFLSSDSLDYGSVLTTTCEAGYHLIGQRERICNEDGLWSGDQPACAHSDQKCFPPKLIRDGFVGFPGNLEEGDE